MTRQRELIINILKQSDRHLTADEIFFLAKLKMPSIAMATIYNNLNAMNEAGLVKRCGCHQHTRYNLVAGAEEHKTVKIMRTDHGFDGCGDQFALGENIMHAFALCHTVTNIGSKIPGSLTASFRHRRYRLLHQFQQMGAAGMAVAKGALHENLRFCSRQKESLYAIITMVTYALTRTIRN